MTDKYLVVIYPAPPPTRGNPTYSAANVTQARVSHVTARSPEDAAEKAAIAPGEHSLVVQVDKCRRFDRASVAPLTELEVDGNPMPQEAEAYR